VRDASATSPESLSSSNIPERKKVMRARWRLCLAPLIMAGAILSAGAPAQFASAAVAHHGITGSFHACPQGTNWDGVACR
jgi:hypothetical protein